LQTFIGRILLTQHKKKFKAPQNWTPFMKPRKIKTQLITTTDSVVQKQEEPNQTFV
jgi:hypothetical protein